MDIVQECCQDWFISIGYWSLCPILIDDVLHYEFLYILQSVLLIVTRKLEWTKHFEGASSKVLPLATLNNINLNIHNSHSGTERERERGIEKEKRGKDFLY